MNTSSPETVRAEPSSDSQASGAPDVRNQRKREFIYAAAGIGTGLFILPAMIYVVGILLLGPYAGGQSLSAFYGAYFGNLLHGVVRTWFVALSPYLAIWVVRLSFKRAYFGSKKGTPPDGEQAESQAETTQVTAKGARREPFISA